MDQFSIQPGEIFPWTIQQAAAHAVAMVVLIGPKWSARDENDHSKFESERDFVRRETTAGLDRGETVIPILLKGADVAGLAQLWFDDMRRLGDLQALELSPRRWDVDTADLIRAVRPAVEDATNGGATERQ